MAHTITTPTVDGSDGDRSRAATQRSSADRTTTWYREVLIIGAFYVVYSMVRNQFGSASVAPSEAFDNAVDLISAQERLGLFVELDIQAMFLDNATFVQLLNIFYGTLHFVVTGGVMIYLFASHREAYLKWRSILAVTTGLALIGFAAFPLMPPRLLNAGGTWGWRAGEFPFIDTLAEIGGLWSFSSEGMQSISNQYAAMPSLHVSWAIWSAAALWAIVPRWSRLLLVAYPAWTIFAIVVTGNHYLLDAAGGAAVIAAAYGLVVMWSDHRSRFPSLRPFRGHGIAATR